VAKRSCWYVPNGPRAISSAFLFLFCLLGAERVYGTFLGIAAVAFWLVERRGSCESGTFVVSYRRRVLTPEVSRCGNEVDPALLRDLHRGEFLVAKFDYYLCHGAVFHGEYPTLVPGDEKRCRRLSMHLAL